MEETILEKLIDNKELYKKYLVAEKSIIRDLEIDMQLFK